MGSVQTGLQWAPPAWSSGCLSQYGKVCSKCEQERASHGVSKGETGKKRKRKLLNSDVEKGQELSKVSEALYMNF